MKRILIVVAAAVVALSVAAGVWFLRDRPPVDTRVAQPAQDLRPPGGEVRERDVLFEWESEKTGGVAAYRIGDLRLDLSLRNGATVNDYTPVTPVLRITDRSGATFEVLGEEGFLKPIVGLGVGVVDRAAQGDQVIFTSYSGGAHCCLTVILAEKLGGAWTATKVATLDGDGLRDFPADKDGDGRREFLVRDDRFLYVFDSYAASGAPPKLLAVENGQVKDVSAEPGFKPVFQAVLPKEREYCETGMNGVCASYAAAAARAGVLEEAWPVILKSYDRKSNWELPTSCRTPGPGQCPPGDVVKFKTYPEALRAFLRENGYPA